MPDIGQPFSGKRSWRVQPGETFTDGGILGDLTLAPSPATLVDGIVSLFLKPQLQSYPLTAPEDGVLTWYAPDGALHTGEPLAAYIPLAAWQEYEGLLTEHDWLIGKRRKTGGNQPAGTVPPGKGDLSGKLDAMIALANAISVRAIRADKSAMLPLLVRQLRHTLRAVCPAAPEDIAPIYHRYFCLIESINERLLLLDTRYAAIWRDPALTGDDGEELVRSWLENKETVIRQVTGEQEELGQEPSNL